MIALRAGSATDTGRVRSINEDRALSGPRMFAVADGMGGYDGGEVASGFAILRLERLGQRQRIRPDDVRGELARANRDIRDHCGTSTGTTVAGLTVVEFGNAEHWAIFNIGDSRVYRFVAGALVQMTVDHSEVAQLVAAGEIDAGQARTHPRRNIVTRALGMAEDPWPDLWVVPATPGERFLICSDGLNGELTDAEIAELLAEPSPQLAAEALVHQAVALGGRDNVTVVVIDHLAAGRPAAVPDEVDEVDGDTVSRNDSAE